MRRSLAGMARDARRSGLNASNRVGYALACPVVMRNLNAILTSLFFASLASAQLTVDQKIVDFQNLAALFSKNYGPYEWKRDRQNFDLMQIGPWLDRIKATKD